MHSSRLRFRWRGRNREMKESVRSCLVCRQRAPKHELLRIVWKGTLVWDRAHGLPGRGAYLHPRAQCWRRMNEVRRWKQALRIATDLTGADVANLQEQVRGMIDDQPPVTSGSRRASPPKIR